MAGEPTFSPNPAPSFSLSASHKPKIRMLNFGDGYIQRVRDGINNDPETIKLKWKNLTQAEHDTLWAFITARGGDQAFMYTVPWKASGNTEKKYIFLDYARERAEAGAYEIEAEIRQVFES